MSLQTPSAPGTSRPVSPRRSIRVRYVVLIGLCLAAAISYISRNSLSVAESTVRRELNLSEHQMGRILSAFFLSYALIQIPAGWLAQRWGARRALPMFAIGWSLATALAACAWGSTLLLTSRLLNGALQGGLFSGCTATVAQWFPVPNRATANGVLVSAMSIGGAVGAGLTGVLVNTLGWRWMFVVYGLLGVAWGLIFWAWFRDRPEDHPAVTAAELQELETSAPDAPRVPPRLGSEPTPWTAMATSPATWCICGQQFFRGAGYIFFASWFATYLQETRNVSIERSGWLTVPPLAAVIFGSLLGGILSDRLMVATGSRRIARQGVSVVMLLACAAWIFVAYFIEDAVAAVLVISAGMLCFAVAGPSAYTITIDMGGGHVAPLFSTMNMCGNLGAAAFPFVVPWLREFTGSWDSVLLLFGAMFLGAAGCWSLLQPAGTVFEQALVRRT